MPFLEGTCLTSLNNRRFCFLHKRNVIILILEAVERSSTLTRYVFYLKTWWTKRFVERTFFPCPCIDFSFFYRFSLSYIFGCWFSCYSPCFTSFASSSNFVTIVGRAMISDIASSYRLWRKISARFSLMTFSKLAKSTLTRFSVKIWMCAFNDDAPKFIWHSMSKFIWKRDYKFTNTDFST